MISCMNPFGAVRRRPWLSLPARSARRCARIFSRSNAITCVRVLNRSREHRHCHGGVVAKVAIAASSVTTIDGLSSASI